MTNYCNKNCSFCLNDFQEKPINNNNLFLDKTIAKSAIVNYSNTFKDKYPLQVYFSGGEPTLHPNILSLLKFAKINNCKVILNTNGSFSNNKEELIMEYTDEIHFGTYEINNKHAEKVKRMKGTIQCVYSSKSPYVTEEFIKYYIKYGLQVKIFADFNENVLLYIYFAKIMNNKFGNMVKFRHTGIQENRGLGCNECKNKCITLKAGWLFPDGGTTPCPQLYKFKKIYPQTNLEWINYFKVVEEFHSV